MKEKLNKFIDYLRSIVWIKLGLDVFTAIVIIYLIVQFFLYERLSAPAWMGNLYIIVLTSFVFTHETSRWVTGKSRAKHYSWYFDHGEIYVTAWLLTAAFLWVMQGILNYPSPEMVKNLTGWVVGAYAISRISKETLNNLLKIKNAKNKKSGSK